MLLKCASTNIENIDVGVVGNLEQLTFSNVRIVSYYDYCFDDDDEYKYYNFAGTCHVTDDAVEGKIMRGRWKIKIAILLTCVILAVKVISVVHNHSSLTLVKNQSQEEQTWSSDVTNHEVKVNFKVDGDGENGTEALIRGTENENQTEDEAKIREIQERMKKVSDVWVEIRQGVAEMKREMMALNKTVAKEKRPRSSTHAETSYNVTKDT